MYADRTLKLKPEIDFCEWLKPLVIAKIVRRGAANIPAGVAALMTTRGERLRFSLDAQFSIVGEQISLIHGELTEEEFKQRIASSQKAAS